MRRWILCLVKRIVRILVILFLHRNILSVCGLAFGDQTEPVNVEFFRWSIHSQTFWVDLDCQSGLIVRVDSRFVWKSLSFTNLFAHPLNDFSDVHSLPSSAPTFIPFMRIHSCKFIHIYSYEITFLSFCLHVCLPTVDLMRRTPHSGSLLWFSCIHLYMHSTRVFQVLFMSFIWSFMELFLHVISSIDCDRSFPK